MNYRSWLRKVPAPTTVQVGDKRLAVVESRTKWADLESSLLAIARDGDTITALDSEGLVLRSVVYDTEQAEDEPEAKTSATSEANADFMVLLAKEINSAHDAGAARHGAAYELAFTKMSEITALVINRITALENMWAKAQIAQAKAQAELLLAQAETQEAQQSQGGMLQSIMPLLEGIGEKMIAKTPDPPALPPKPQTSKKG